MKASVLFSALLVMMITSTGCAQLFDNAQDAFEDATKSSSGSLTQEDAAKGIKEALTKGVKNGVTNVSQVNGYFKNSKIKIPFPPDAQEVADKMRDIGMGNQVDKVVKKLNRAAEDAATKAKPIFVDAIRSLTIRDAINLVNGQNNAATNYLRNNTSSNLQNAFKPDIKRSLEKVNATKYWDDVITRYNKIPLVEDKNPDLAEYVTGRAIKGLFFMVEKEEKKIRRDPMARTSEILEKVFGGS